MENGIINIREHSEIADTAAKWFHSKWGIPLEAYMESITACLEGKSSVPQWYVAVEDNRIVTDHTSFYERYDWEFLCMVQGDGEPDMTRMYIHRI